MRWVPPRSAPPPFSREVAPRAVRWRGRTSCWGSPCRSCRTREGDDALKNTCDGGEAILEAFRNLGIDYIMSSPGSEWSPVWEALARQKTGNRPGPTYFDVWHESTAVDMAIGYTQMTGRMQAVLLHAGAGLLQGAMAIQAAQQTEVPMLGVSGESHSVGEDPNFEPGMQWHRRLPNRRR